MPSLEGTMKSNNKSKGSRIPANGGKKSINGSKMSVNGSSKPANGPRKPVNGPRKPVNGSNKTNNESRELHTENAKRHKDSRSISAPSKGSNTKHDDQNKKDLNVKRKNDEAKKPKSELNHKTKKPKNKNTAANFDDISCSDLEIVSDIENASLSGSSSFMSGSELDIEEFQRQFPSQNDAVADSDEGENAQSSSDEAAHSDSEPEESESDDEASSLIEIDESGSSEDVMDSDVDSDLKVDAIPNKKNGSEGKSDSDSDSSSDANDINFDASGDSEDWGSDLDTDEDEDEDINEDIDSDDSIETNTKIDKKKHTSAKDINVQLEQLLPASGESNLKSIKQALSLLSQDESNSTDSRLIARILNLSFPAFEKLVPCTAASKNNPKFTKHLVTPLNSLMLVFCTLIESRSDPELLRVAVECMSKCLPYYLFSLKRYKRICFAACSIFATASETLIIPTARLLKFSIETCPTLASAILTKTFNSTIMNLSKSLNAYTHKRTNIVIQALPYIFLADQRAAYEVLTLSLKDMALKLRGSSHSGTEKSAASSSASKTVDVCNWHTVFWMRCLFGILTMSYSQSNDKPTDKAKPTDKTTDKMSANQTVTLTQLSFPIIQISLGILSVVPPLVATTPFKLHILQTLISFLRNSEASLYVPLAFPLIQVLNEQNAAFKKSTASSSSSTGSSDMSVFSLLNLTLRIPDSQLTSKLIQDQILQWTVYLIADYSAVYAKSIAFPDFILPLQIQLKRIVKREMRPNTNPQRQLLTLLEKWNQHAQIIESERSKVFFDARNTSKSQTLFEQSNSNWPLISYFTQQIKIRSDLLRNLELEDDTQSGEAGNKTNRNFDKKSKAQSNQTARKKQSFAEFNSSSDSEDDKRQSKSRKTV